DAESHDVLQVHVPRQSRHLIADLVGIEAWRLVEEEGVPVELIRPAPGHHLNVAPAGPSRISGCIAGQYPEFREHVRIRPNGRKVATELLVGGPFPAAALETLRYAGGERAEDAVLTARLFTGAEAVEAGLVHEYVAADG